MSAEPGGGSPGAGPYREAVAPAGGELPDGLLVSWSESVAPGDLLAAARRQLRQQAGHDVPAWGEPEAQQAERHDSNDPGDLNAADLNAEDLNAEDLNAEDPYGDD